MRYLVVAESDWKDVEKNSELTKQLMDERDSGVSDRFPSRDQILLRAHNLHADLPKRSKDVQFVWAFETENPKQLVNYTMFYAPYIDCRFIPITEATHLYQAWLGWRR